jgi:hypothetical protein
MTDEQQGEADDEEEGVEIEPTLEGQSIELSDADKDE